MSTRNSDRARQRDMYGRAEGIACETDVVPVDRRGLVWDVHSKLTPGAKWILGWSFAVSRADAHLPVLVSADSAQEASIGEWTSLTGVYDEADREIRLYVNSAISAAVPIPPDVRFTHVPGSPPLQGDQQQRAVCIQARGL